MASAAIAGPCSVVLMGYRRSKQGHNAITQHLVHGAFVAVHRLHHQMQSRVEEVPRRLRIEAGNQLRRALEVGKQHRDLLALAFQSGTAGEALFYEMRWSVSQGRTVLGWGWHSGQSRRGLASPDQHFAILVGSQSLGRNDL